MRKFFKIALYILCSILLLILLVIVFLQTRWGKNFVRTQAVNYLNGKLENRVTISTLDYHIPDMFLLEGVLVRDVKQDTLLEVKRLAIDMDMLALIRGKVSADNILLDGVNAYIYRTLPDTTFNYQFIIDAFAGKEEEPVLQPVADSTSSRSSPLDLDIVRVNLKNIRLRYHDATGGTFFSLQLQNLLLRPKKIKLEAMRFEVDELYVSGLQSEFTIDTSYLPPPPPDTAAASDIQLVIDKIHLDNIAFSFINKVDPMQFHIDLGLLNGQVPYFGLSEQLVQVDQFQLEQVRSRFELGKKKTGNTATPTVDDTTTDTWRVTANNIMLKQVGFILDDQNQPKQSTGVDYAHLDIQNFSLNAAQVLYSADTIAAQLKHLSLTEQSGLNIIELRSHLTYHNQGALLQNLYLLTPNTRIQNLLEVNYPSLAALDKEMHKMHLNINLEKSKIGMTDVFYFLPAEQRKMLEAYAKEQLEISGVIKGYLNALQLYKLSVSGLSGTNVQLSGQLKGLPDSDKLQYDLNIADFRSTFKDIAPFVPDNVQQQVRIPDWFALSGHVSGTLKDYYPDITLTSSDGNARIKGALRLSPGEGKEQYDLNMGTYTLNLGRILRMDTLLGTLSVQGMIKGTGFDPEQMNTVFDISVQSAGFMNYNYNGIHLAGNIADKIGEVKGTSTDPNAMMNLDAWADLNGQYPALKAAIQVNNLDLQALKLYEDTFRIISNIHADFKSLNPDYPSGELTVTQSKVNLTGQEIELDSVYLSSRPDADSLQDIYLNVGDILRARLSGHIPLTQMGNAAMTHVDRHYQISDTLHPIPQQYDMEMDAAITYHPRIKSWFPLLKPFDTIKIDAGFDPETLHLNVYAPRLIYGANRLDSVSVFVSENVDTMRYGVALKKFKQDQLELWSPSLNGRVHHDSIYAYVNIRDSAGQSQMGIGGALHKDLQNDSSLTYFRLFKGLRFDYERWDVNPDNRIVFGPDGFYVKDFYIKKGNQTIALNSVRPEFNVPLKLSIQNFALSNVTRMLSTDTLLADGVLDANATLDLSDSFPRVDARLTIANLQVFNEAMGQLTVDAKNETADAYHANVNFTGNDNDLNLKGNYYVTPVDSNEFNFDLNINQLNLKSLQGLTFGALKNSSGLIKGNLNLRGSAKRPRIIGILETEQLTTTVTALNTPFTFPQEKINFTDRGILLDNFTILDRNSRKATIDGSVRSRDFTRYFLDLNVKASKWQAAHSTQKDNELFYGDLVVSTDLNIRGLATAPKIDGNITVHDSTNLSYALLDEGPGMQETEGIVVFTDSRDSAWASEADSITQKRGVRFSGSTQMNVNVEVEKGATFNVVIDPLTGDNLQVKGLASLNTFIGPDGRVGLTGTYELNDGYYELNYNFIRRRFKISPGSKVTLSGDPLDAEVDITAIYTANIAPYDLVDKQVDPEQLVFYKQRLPFDVVLKLKGKVLQPETSFDIVLEEEKAGGATSDVVTMIQRKLVEMRNNPSETNKQVFAVLILNRFIGEDPFSSGSSVGVEYAARQSASRFLSSQLNQLADQFIQGFELNLDLSSSEDYTTGEKSNRTDLSVSASKRLLDDRLTITVGNDFQLEGQRAQTQQSSLVPGNLSADYHITPDGKYMVRAYRKNELQNVIDGYVIETGVTFRVTLEYNRFKYIFINREKYMEKMRARRIAEALKEKEG